MFPGTPVKLLKEVFEALQLYDLIDLFEEEKPRATRSLGPALRLQEIEKLRNPDDRPISYHSSVAVLLIDGGQTSDTEGVERFFKGLNNKSEVAVMSCRNFLKEANIVSLKRLHLLGGKSLRKYAEGCGGELREGDEQIEIDFFRSHTKLNIQSRLMKMYKRKLK